MLTGKTKLPMTTAELKMILRNNGVSHIKTYGGPVPLADWTPYGNGIENRVRFDRIDWKECRIHEVQTGPGIYGVWEFAMP